MEEYILIKKDTLERFVENWIMQDRQDEFLEKIKHHSEVVQELEKEKVYVDFPSIVISDFLKVLTENNIKLLKIK